MGKDKLIVKQQLEIEELKEEVHNYKEVVSDVRGFLCRPEQWSPKCPNFPNVAMSGIVKALREIDNL